MRRPEDYEAWPALIQHLYDRAETEREEPIRMLVRLVMSDASTPRERHAATQALAAISPSVDTQVRDALRAWHRADPDVFRRLLLDLAAHAGLDSPSRALLNDLLDVDRAQRAKA